MRYFRYIEALNQRVGEGRDFDQLFLCVLHSSRYSKAVETPEHKAERRARLKAKLATEESRKKRSETSKRNWLDENYRKKTQASMKRTANSEEGKAKLLEAAKKGWLNEDKRPEMMAKQKKTMSDPAFRAKRSEIAKQLWQRKDYRDKIQEALVNRALDESLVQKTAKGSIKGLATSRFGDIRFDSSLERYAIELLDANEECIGLSRCRDVVPNGDRKYIPDFAVKTKNRDFIVEIKGAMFFGTGVEKKAEAALEFYGNGKYVLLVSNEVQALSSENLEEVLDKCAM